MGTQQMLLAHSSVHGRKSPVNEGIEGRTIQRTDIPF